MRGREIRDEEGESSRHSHIPMETQASNLNQTQFQTNHHLTAKLRSFLYRQHCKTSPLPSCAIRSLSNPTWHLPSNSFQPTTTKNAQLSLALLLCGISSNSHSTDGKRSFRDWVEVVGEDVSTAFPVWVALGCLLGLIKPTSFNWVTPNLTILGITLTMLGMGMTLTFDDFLGALAMPKELLAGFVLQYSVMPLSGYFVSKLLNLPSYYAAGLILVGCCPGGTASNIVTYIARGNVALSVLMTAASTLSAVIMTPYLTAKLAGQYVAVDAAGLLLSTLQVVLLPVLAGAFLNQYFQGLVKLVSPLMPPIAVGTVAVLCGNAIAQSSSAILMSGKKVVLAASLLHACGFFFGYTLARILGLDVASSRTISTEVGMQNSVLGVVLATQHFGNPLTAVPCAVSSVCHSIFGSVLAGVWRQECASSKARLKCHVQAFEKMYKTRMNPSVIISAACRGNFISSTLDSRAIEFGISGATLNNLNL